MTKRALILGATGQDGSLLADLLLERGYTVAGMYRHTSLGNLDRVRHLLTNPAFTLHRGDLIDVGSLYSIISEVKPDLCFNEADQDNVGWSRSLPGLASRVTYTAVADLLEIVRRVVPQCRVFQPCSSTMFGDAPAPQSETTPFNPQSPYAVAKVAAYYLCRMYRQQYGMHVSCGILFNHTSTRQTEEYLLHKICAGAVRIARGQQETLALGNLDTKVDIGCAREYMEAAIAMVERDAPDDFVIATGGAPSIGHLAGAALLAASAATSINDAEEFVSRDPVFWTEQPFPTMRGHVEKTTYDLHWQAKRSPFDLVRELVKHYEGRP